MIRRACWASTRRASISPASSMACEHGLLGDLVETDALEGLALAGRLQRLVQVPGDRLAFAVRVGREKDGVGRLDRAPQLLERLLLALEDLVGRRVGVVAVDAQTLLGQVPDVAVGGEDAEVLPEKLLEGLRLGGRLDDDEASGHWRHLTTAPLFPILPPGTRKNRPGLLDREPGALELEERRRAPSPPASPSPRRGPRPCTSPLARAPRAATCASGERSPATAGYGGTGLGFPTEGKSSESTSSAPRQRIAPSRSSSCAPAEVSEKTLPGTANTSRPKSLARRAVMSEPVRREASTTTTPDGEPRDDPVADREVLRPRLRPRRVLGEKQVRFGHRLLQARVLARVVDVEPAAQNGDRAAGPLPRGLVRRASTPRAKPDTTPPPPARGPGPGARRPRVRNARPRGSRRWRRRAGSSRSRPARAKSTKGGSGISESAAGYSGSKAVTRRRPEPSRWSLAQRSASRSSVERRSARAPRPPSRASLDRAPSSGAGQSRASERAGLSQGPPEIAGAAARRPRAQESAARRARRIPT